jgi:hypothetical protein
MHLSPESLCGPTVERRCTLKRVDSVTCSRLGPRLVAGCFFQMAAEPIAHRREHPILKIRLTS